MADQSLSQRTKGTQTLHLDNGVQQETKTGKLHLSGFYSQLMTSIYTLKIGSSARYATGLCRHELLWPRSTEMQEGSFFAHSESSESHCPEGEVILMFSSLHKDRLCGLVVRVLGYRSRGPGSIAGATRFSEKKWVWNGLHSASCVHSRSYLEEKSSGSSLEIRKYGRRDPSR
jgi:hypothetical protein